MSTDVLGRNKIKVGVLRGGPSHEYEISLQTGAHVLQNLPKEYLPQDIFISRDGDWHSNGIVRSPSKLVSQVDVIFNALHGKYGEDGKVQAILEGLNKPYTGSKSFGSALGMHKGLAKRMFGEKSIKTPYHIILSPKDNVQNRVIEIFQSFPQPSIIKPLKGGSSLATTYANDFSTFEKALELAFRHSGLVLVEEYISGQEATCAVIDNSGGERAYALFPIEIVSGDSKKIFDYESKCEPRDNLCLNSFSAEIKKALQDLSLGMHMALGLRHYSRSDFIISPTRGIYALETNSLPALTNKSAFYKSLENAGISFSDFLSHILKLAITK